MFETAQICELGGRETNQDAVWSGAAGEWFGWALADGLGGMGGGEIASEAALRAIAEGFGQNPDLMQLGEAANEAVRAKQVERPEWKAMRTTLVLLASNGQEARWVYSGDSRLYRFRAGAIVEQTLDHSVPQTLVDAGRIPASEIRQHPDRNRLLKSLGGLTAELSAGAATVESGDAFLLASDGFWELVTELEMEAELVRARGAAEWLGGMQLRLRERLARMASGEADNESAIAVWRV